MRVGLVGSEMCIRDRREREREREREGEKYKSIISINCACIYHAPCGPKRGFSHHRRSCFRAASEYQQCVAAGANDFRDCNEILLKQATVDCLAGSDTPLIDYYRGCLGSICKNDNKLVESLIRYIYYNRCGEDGKSGALVVVLVLIFRVVSDHWY